MIIHKPIFSIPDNRSATLFQALLSPITSSYAQIGSEIDCQGHTTLFLHLYWTQGDATSVEIKTES